MILIIKQLLNCVVDFSEAIELFSSKNNCQPDPARLSEYDTLFEQVILDIGNELLESFERNPDQVEFIKAPQIQSIKYLSNSFTILQNYLHNCDIKVPAIIDMIRNQLSRIKADNRIDMQFLFKLSTDEKDDENELKIEKIPNSYVIDLPSNRQLNLEKIFTAMRKNILSIQNISPFKINIDEYIKTQCQDKPEKIDEFFNTVLKTVDTYNMEQRFKPNTAEQCPFQWEGFKFKEYESIEDLQLMRTQVYNAKRSKQYLERCMENLRPSRLFVKECQKRKMKGTMDVKNDMQIFQFSGVIQEAVCLYLKENDKNNITKRGNTIIDMIQKHFLINHYHCLTYLDLTDIHIKIVKPEKLLQDIKSRMDKAILGEIDVAKKFKKALNTGQQEIIIAFQEDGQLLVDYTHFDLFWEVQERSIKRIEIGHMDYVLTHRHLVDSNLVNIYQNELLQHVKENKDPNEILKYQCIHYAIEKVFDENFQIVLFEMLQGLMTGMTYQRLYTRYNGIKFEYNLPPNEGLPKTKPVNIKKFNTVFKQYNEETDGMFPEHRNIMSINQVKLQMFGMVFKISVELTRSGKIEPGVAEKEYKVKDYRYDEQDQIQRQQHYWKLKKELWQMIHSFDQVESAEKKKVESYYHFTEIDWGKYDLVEKQLETLHRRLKKGDYNQASAAFSCTDRWIPHWAIKKPQRKSW